LRERIPRMVGTNPTAVNGLIIDQCPELEIDSRSHTS
jgi:hypothetical protein